MDFFRGIAHILERIASGEDKLAVVVASHNEDSVRKACEAVTAIKDSPRGSFFDKESVVFGQLYGMGNYVTNLLSTQLVQLSFMQYSTLVFFFHLSSRG